MSYLSGVALLFLVVVGGVFGLYMVISHANLNAPVDSDGLTTSLADNSTRQVVEESAPSILYVAGGIGLITGVMLLIASLIYIAAGGKSGYKSRY